MYRIVIFIESEKNENSLYSSSVVMGKSKENRVYFESKSMKYNLMYKL
jgi:hypothetical protein